MNTVIDTNVLVSGLLHPERIPAAILSLLLNGKIIPLYDNRIISEYADVLSRKKFGFSKETVYPLLDYIQNEGIFVPASPVQKRFTDDGDKKFYEVAISGNAQYLITGNKKHYPKDSLIISPADFVESSGSK